MQYLHTVQFLNLVYIVKVTIIRLLLFRGTRSGEVNLQYENASSTFHLPFTILPKIIKLGTDFLTTLLAYIGMYNNSDMYSTYLYN